MAEEIIQRKLSAIVFTDIVGYTRMIGQDEDAALDFMKFHNALLREEIEKNGGRVIKAVGDAFLADFSSAVNAVHCAVSIQKRFIQYRGETGKTQQVRIGRIHLGDVVLTDNDMFGESVNIAERIQHLAEPGGVSVSQDVFNTIRNKAEFKTVSLGRKELKNISGKIEIFKVVVEDSKPQKKDAQKGLNVFLRGFGGAGGGGLVFLRTSKRR